MTPRHLMRRSHLVPAVIDRNVAADVPAEILQRFGKFGQAGLRLRIVLGVSHADPAHTAGLLPRAASGHVAALPTSAMNSRRFILSRSARAGFAVR